MENAILNLKKYIIFLKAYTDKIKKQRVDTENDSYTKNLLMLSSLNKVLSRVDKPNSFEDSFKHELSNFESYLSTLTLNAFHTINSKVKNGLLNQKHSVLSSTLLINSIEIDADFTLTCLSVIEFSKVHFINYNPVNKSFEIKGIQDFLPK